MSILAKLKAAEPQTAKQNILITGRSGSGKTTLAGTLPGKTLLLQVAGKEFGAETAKAQAAANGNLLDTLTVSSLTDFVRIGAELKDDTEYDSIFVDSLSGLTFMAGDDPEISQLIQMKKGNSSFIGYNRVEVEMRKVHKAFTDLLYAPTKTPKNIIFTLAIEPKLDAAGGIAEIKPIMVGQASYQVFTQPSPTILTVATRNTETGPERIMLTANHGMYISRVNGLLDAKNPKVMEPNLAKLFELINNTKETK